MFLKYNWLQEDNRLLWVDKRYDPSGNIVVPFAPSLYLSFFNSANLVISSDPIIESFIKLSDDTVLKYPHVEYNGKVCLNIDLQSNVTEAQYIKLLIESFCNDFLEGVISGAIQEDFYKEPEHYWTINVRKYEARNYKKSFYIKKDITKQFGRFTFPDELLLLNKRPAKFLEYKSTILGDKYIIASLDSPYKKQLSQLYGLPQKKIPTIEIPITECYVPKQWPKNIKEIFETISIFLDDSFAKKYTLPSNLIILRAPSCNYAYYINEKSELIPLQCSKADIEWIYGRYKNNNIIRNQLKKIVCFGAGALGSQVIPLLVREGIGEIIVVDYDLFDTPNISRHLLGINSLSKSKVSELGNYINSYLPTCKLIPEKTTVEKWLQKAEANNLLNEIELFIDLTGSEKVRNVLDGVRVKHEIPLITGWMEPFVSAAHSVFLPSGRTWKAQETDLWKEVAAFRGWPEKYMENEPGCSSRFQSYSGIEALKAVSIIAETCVNFFSFDDISKFSQIEVTSLIRGKEFCEKQEYQAEERASWADIPSNIDSAIIKRFFK